MGVSVSDKLLHILNGSSPRNQTVAHTNQVLGDEADSEW